MDDDSSKSSNLKETSTVSDVFGIWSCFTLLGLKKLRFACNNSWLPTLPYVAKSRKKIVLNIKNSQCVNHPYRTLLFLVHLSSFMQPARLCSIGGQQLVGSLDTTFPEADRAEISQGFNMVKLPGIYTVSYSSMYAFVSSKPQTSLT